MAPEVMADAIVCPGATHSARKPPVHPVRSAPPRSRHSARATQVCIAFGSERRTHESHTAAFEATHAAVDVVDVEVWDRAATHMVGACELSVLPLLSDEESRIDTQLDLHLAGGAPIGSVRIVAEARRQDAQR